MYRPVSLLPAVACEITVQSSTIGINLARFTNTFGLIIQLTNAAVNSREKTDYDCIFFDRISCFFFPVSFFCRTNTVCFGLVIGQTISDRRVLPQCSIYISLSVAWLLTASHESAISLTVYIVYKYFLPPFPFFFKKREKLRALHYCQWMINFIAKVHIKIYLSSLHVL